MWIRRSVVRIHSAVPNNPFDIPHVFAVPKGQRVRGPTREAVDRPPADKAPASAGCTLLLLADDTCVLVAVLHIRLIRPGRPGVFV
jgi:hypothetical protein